MYFILNLCYITTKKYNNLIEIIKMSKRIYNLIDGYII